MNPETQQIAIAKICGWTEIQKRYGRDPDEDRLEGKHPPLKNFYKDGRDYIFHGKQDLPKYLLDLNAIHKAEEFLRPPLQENWILWLKYSEILSLICGERIPLFASAEKRAEAFLKVLNSWEED